MVILKPRMACALGASLAIPRMPKNGEIKTKNVVIEKQENGNKEQIAEWKRRAYAANQTGERARRVLRQYNVTPEQYAELLASQNGCCAVCKCDTPNGRFKKWHLDHDHSCCPGKFSCGKCIRGLLCHKCNVGMGNLSDDYKLLRAAADYLEAYEKKTNEPISATRA